MLHGFLSSSAQWQDNLAALQRVCKPVTIELWGHGQSPAPTDPQSYAPERYVEQLEAIRRELGVAQWFLCGYSIGAGMTIRYAHCFPEHVVGHVFTNSSSGFADETLAAQWLADSEATAEAIITGGGDAIRRIAVHPRFAKRLPKPVYDALNADAEHLVPLAVANTLRYTTPYASVREIAPHNPKPALLCHGAKEKRFFKSKSWAEQHMANLTVVELDAGHAVNMEDAEGFNTALSAFIQQHQP